VVVVRARTLEQSCVPCPDGSFIATFGIYSFNSRVWSGTGGAHRQQTSPVCPGPVRVDMQLLATMLVPFVRGRPTPKQCRYRPVSRRLSRWWHSARAGEALWLRQAPPPETVVSIYASIGGLFGRDREQLAAAGATPPSDDLLHEREATYGAPVRLRARVELRLTRDVRSACVVAGRASPPAAVCTARPRGGDVVLLHALDVPVRLVSRYLCTCARTRVLACWPGRVGGWH
jgi:hypothetical protein